MNCESKKIAEFLDPTNFLLILKNLNWSFSAQKQKRNYNQLQNIWDWL